MLTANECPDQAPGEMENKKVANINVQCLQQHIAVAAHTDRLLIEDGQPQECQCKHTECIDPVKNSRRSVPDRIGNAVLAGMAVVVHMSTLVISNSWSRRSSMVGGDVTARSSHCCNSVAVVKNQHQPQLPQQEQNSVFTQFACLWAYGCRLSLQSASGNA